LYWKRFIPKGSFADAIHFYLKLLAAFIPAMLAGLFLNDYIDALLERVDVVGYMLITGGVFFLFVDSIFAANENNVPADGRVINEDVLDYHPKVQPREVTYPIAFKIGLFQTIAMIPGVSRSAATIIGGLTQKLNKKTAAEFSFFLAVPTMFAATAYKLLKFYKASGTINSSELTLLAIGNIVAFIVAFLAIRSFITFLTKHGFKLFGYYRIVVGAIILILYYMKVGLTIV
jgi:undecaprenyl-diphosphatase